ncbi:helix-turn-helix transcriptional regulator [Burkholderia sp. MS455]|uniref:helix-turn-helix domain-containing protein n=1 Tax=Burkholderia sp. MS455 TaxID=2811788 RepID=UPI001EF40189|nr:helix-turn-helix transcriptional regulator [Burkholderia sp. MS455]
MSEIVQGESIARGGSVMPLRVRMPLEWLRECGTRAMRRRETLGLTIVEVAENIGVSAASLMRWERGHLPQQLCGNVLTQWERCLDLSQGELMPPGIQPFQSILSVPSKRIDGQTVADVIWGVAHYLVSNGCGAAERRWARRDAEIFARRFGVCGHANSTLAMIGIHVGLTRERVRQILHQMLLRARRCHFDIPAIVALRETCLSFVPDTLETLDLALKPSLGAMLSLVDAHRFARDILADPFLRISKPTNASQGSLVMALRSSQGDLASTGQAVSRQIQRMIRTAGAVHMPTMMTQLHSECASEVAVLRKRIELTKGFEWLDAAHEWFWIREASGCTNMAVLVAEKMFAVAVMPLSGEDVLRGMRRYAKKSAWRLRHYQFGTRTLPPVSIIEAVLARLPWLHRMQHNRYQAKEPCDLLQSLSATERKIWEVSRDRGGVAGRAELVNWLVSEGHVRFDAIAATMTTTPILAHVTRGVYALCGWPTALGERVGHVE